MRQAECAWQAPAIPHNAGLLRTFGLSSLEELPELELAELGTPDQLTLEEAASGQQELNS